MKSTVGPTETAVVITNCGHAVTNATPTTDAGFDKITVINNVDELIEFLSDIDIATPILINSTNGLLSSPVFAIEVDGNTGKTYLEIRK